MDEFGITPLHLAALDPLHHDRLLTLLESGADIRAKTTTTVANVASQIRRPDGATFYLFDRHPDLPAGIGFDKGSNPLHFAARMGHFEAVRALVEHKAREVKNGAGGTALHLAALAGSEEVVRFLLKKKFKVGPLSKLKKSIAFYDVGMTPILCALQSGNIGSIDALLDAGADLTTKTKFGCDAVFFAARGGSLAALNRVLDARVPVPETGKYMNFPLVEAVASSNVDVVKRLLDAGSPTRKGRVQAPLRLATERNALPIRAALLKGGTEPLEHRSASAAARANDVTDLQTRIDRGEDISSAVDGMTPLMHAACMKFDAAAEVLIRGGADVNICVSNGTAIHYATSNQAWSVLRVLVDANADCLPTDQHGNDGLLSAVIHGAPTDILKTMLDGGADPQVFNNTAQMPI